MDEQQTQEGTEAASKAEDSAATMDQKISCLKECIERIDHSLKMCAKASDASERVAMAEKYLTEARERCAAELADCEKALQEACAG